jgi:hypothetical protein
MVSAFHVYGGLGHPEGGDKRGRGLGDPGQIELVDAGIGFLGRDVHGFSQVPGGHVVHKFPGLFRIDRGVFSGAAGGLVGRKHDIGRIKGQVLKLAVRGQV